MAAAADCTRASASGAACAYRGSAWALRYSRAFHGMVLTLIKLRDARGGMMS
jgi:hypothetical protein